MTNLEIAAKALRDAVVRESAGGIEDCDNGYLQDSDSNLGWDSIPVARSILEAIGVDPDAEASTR